MKYTCEIEINQPVKKVIELIDNAENMKHWMKGLESYEILNGNGDVGTKMKMIFNHGKRKMEMIETIVKKDLPQAWHATYEAKNVWNRQENSFISTPSNHTIWRADSEFKFSGIMKFFALLYGKNGFKKQSMKHLVAFKEFAESQ